MAPPSSCRERAPHAGLDLGLDLSTEQLTRADIFATEPLAVDELHADASTVRIAGVDVRVASRRHLIAMKQRAGRPRDLDDVAALESLDE